MLSNCAAIRNGKVYPPTSIVADHSFDEWARNNAAAFKIQFVPTK
jgi:hypothetical protein